MLSNFRTPDDVNLLFALKCFMLHTSAMVQLKEEIFFRIEKSKRMNFFLIWRVVIRLLICWVAIFLKCNDEALRGEKYARKVPTSLQIHFGSSKRCTILHQNHMILSLSLKRKLFCAGTNIALHISMHFSIFKSISYLLPKLRNQLTKSADFWLSKSIFYVKIIRNFLIFFFIEEYHFRGTFFVIDIFW